LSLRLKYLLVFAAILILSCLARFTGLDQRPMHNDEAVNAYKLGTLIESGEFRYDRNEYHGPLLYYTSRVLTGLLGQSDYISLTESSLRSVTAIFGIGLLVLLLLLAESLGWVTLLTTALLFAVAPAMVFYSRYFIHEMLLVFFSMAALVTGFKYLVSPKILWAILFGVSLGLMHATKETCIINYAALGAAALTILFVLKRTAQNGPRHQPYHHWHGLVFLLGAGLTSTVLYSSFFSHPKGIVDAMTAYQSYFIRAVADDAHLHPWHYYLDLLVFHPNPSGPAWSELWLLLLALAGFILAIFKKDRQWGDYFMLYTGLYTFLLMTIYSLISYKTPWNILSCYAGLLLLAGYGLVRIFQLPGKGWMRTGLIAGVLMGGIYWLYTSYSINFRHCSEPANPYVYAQAGKDVVALAEAVDRVGLAHPDGWEMPIEIIMPDHEYWPLPWYLRNFTHTAWWDHVDPNPPAAPLIIADAAVEKELIRKLYELPPPGQRYLYLSLFSRYMELRPGQEIRAYLRKDIWDLLPEDMKKVD
jgi:uncharacterized protein (TIGR03663 family)